MDHVIMLCVHVDGLLLLLLLLNLRAIIVGLIWLYNVCDGRCGGVCHALLLLLLRLLILLLLRLLLWGVLILRRRWRRLLLLRVATILLLLGRDLAVGTTVHVDNSIDSRGEGWRYCYCYF